MINSIYTHILDETSKNLNMTRQHLKSDTKRLAEYWEVALEQGNINDTNVAILFLDTGIHGYLKAKGLPLGNKKTLKRDQFVLNGMILLIAMYALDQPKEQYPKINELTPLPDSEMPDDPHKEDILDMAEKILRDKRKYNS